MKSEYKIGEVASLLGVTVRTIRFYEEEGLLHPSRTAGGTRLYSKNHVSRLKAILHLAQNNFSLEAVRLIATVRENCRTGDESSKEVSSRLDQAADALAKRMAELEKLRLEIVRTKALVGRCGGCKNHPSSKGCPECPVKKHAGQQELLNLIWDQDT